MLKIRTKLACEIAGIDPARFNDAIHSNLFPCAPQTRPGASRIFEIEDIIVMRIYRQLIDPAGPRFAAEKAGGIACDIRVRIADPEVKAVSYAVSTSGPGKIMSRALALEDSIFGDGSPIFFAMNFNIGALRAQITEHLNHEQQIFGED